jgi:hypothetical protein
MKRKYFVLLALLGAVVFASNDAHAQKNSDREYYELKVYHFKDTTQERILNTYFQLALLPALHRQKIEYVGVFKAIANDTAADKLIYVFTPFKSLKEMQQVNKDIIYDKAYNAAGPDYLEAAYNKPPYTRMEVIILYAFPLAPKMQLPQLRSAANERVYELRSYESATEKIFANKVQMFNQGGEVPLFKRLNFNAVFYSEVIAGSHMPNLMYMTTFENMADREAHWKTFGEDAEWKKLSSIPEYQNNVQHIDITFLRPLPYSDF